MRFWGELSALRPSNPLYGQLQLVVSRDTAPQKLLN
jgi:hypothetical protein